MAKKRDKNPWKGLIILAVLLLLSVVVFFISRSGNGGKAWSYEESLREIQEQREKELKDNPPQHGGYNSNSTDPVEIFANDMSNTITLILYFMVATVILTTFFKIYRLIYRIYSYDGL